jgi:signal transduction histidine kinase
VAAAAWNVYAFVVQQANTAVVDVRSDGTVVPERPGSLSPEQLHEITRQLTGVPRGPQPPGALHTIVRPFDFRIIVDLTPPLSTWGGFWLAAVVLLVVWVAGASARRRRGRLDWLRRQHETQARLAVLDERARISRELHDVVAHGLSVVVLQAQGGAAALEYRPERTREALDAIVVTGRHALAEIRRLLHALGDEESERWAPPPGVMRLPELCDQVRATGLPVELRVDGDPYEPPTAVDVAAYRIVQEALTNVLKHAGKHAATRVTLCYRPESVAVEVANDPARDGAPEPDRTGPGTGLRGMRERVTLLDGTFDAGPDPAGGFVVRATLPLEGRE